MKRVASVDEVPARGAVPFAFGGREGFLVRAPTGELRAYLNVCAHHARPLDAVTGTFWADDAPLLECGEHGARYDPSTGRCVEGPCAGASLDPIRIEVREGVVYAQIESELAFDSE